MSVGAFIVCMPAQQHSTRQVTPEKVLFGARDLGLCSLQIVVMTCGTMCPCLPRGDQSLPLGPIVRADEIGQLALMLFAVATAEG